MRDDKRLPLIVVAAIVWMVATALWLLIGLSFMLVIRLLEWIF